MATKTAKKTETADTTENVNLTKFLSVKPTFKKFSLWLIGDAPLITHAWSQKARLEMLQKQVKSAKAGREARDPTNPLHKHFEWEDGVAAEAYRVQQARALIRIVLVADDTKPEAPPTRAFFAINDEKEGYSYRPVAQVVSSVEMRLSLLKSARRDLRAFRERYRSIKELCDPLEELFDLLDQAESSLSSSRPAA